MTETECRKILKNIDELKPDELDQECFLTPQSFLRFKKALEHCKNIEFEGDRISFGCERLADLRAGIDESSGKIYCVPIDEGWFRLENARIVSDALVLDINHADERPSFIRLTADLLISKEPESFDLEDLVSKEAIARLALHKIAEEGGEIYEKATLLVDYVGSPAKVRRSLEQEYPWLKETNFENFLTNWLKDNLDKIVAKRELKIGNYTIVYEGLPGSTNLAETHSEIVVFKPTTLEISRKDEVLEYELKKPGIYKVEFDDSLLR